MLFTTINGITDSIKTPSNKTITGCFVFLFLGFIIVFSYLTPPFQAPDEPAHLFRAYQISQGEIVGKKINDVASGGGVDVGLFELLNRFDPYIPGGAPPVDPNLYEAVRAIGWKEQKVNADFRNTVQYAPFAYAPQAAALAIGKALGLSVMDSYVLARTFAALTASILAVTAVVMLRTTAASGFILSLLLLPMSVFLIASTSQDGILLGLGALLAAVVARSFDREPGRGLWLPYAATACITILALARLPYLALLPLLWMPALWSHGGGRRFTVRLPMVLCTLFVLAAFAGWLVMTEPVRVKVYPLNDKVVSATDQLLFLVRNPTFVWHLTLNTLLANLTSYTAGFIGILGWLSISLPRWGYRFAMVSLMATFAAAPPPANRTTADVTLVGLALVLSTGGVFLAQYLTWTAVGAPVIDGVQGRYFLPIAPLLLILTLPFPARFAKWRRMLGFAGLLLLLPVCLIAARALFVRFVGQ